MKRILAILFSSSLLAACGLDHPALFTPVPTSLVASTPLMTAVKSGVTAAPLLSYTSTPSKTCGSYEWGRRIYLDEIPAFAIRQGPGCEYPVAQGRLFKTDPLAFFDVLGKQGDWLSVDLCNNAQGWVFSPAINDVNMDVNLDDLPVLAPPATPVVTGAALPPLTGDGTMEAARRTLISFFDFLQDKNYVEAARLFGGGYGNIIMWNPDVDSRDYPTLLKYACEWNDFQCFLKLGRIIKEEQLSPMEYQFTLEFINEDGSLYQRRNDPLDQNSMISRFPFRVVRDCDGKYLVIDWPFYPQYLGG